MIESFFVKRLNRNEINDDRWNKLIDEALLSKSYLYSWSLDTVSPNWQALVLNDYEAAFVLPIKKKFGITYLIQPNFIQQLGCISKEKNEKFLKYCLKYIRKHFIYYRINLNEIDSEILQSIKKSRKLINVFKSIGENADNCEGYNTNTKRNITKFYSSGFEIVETDDYKGVIELFKKDRGTKVELNDYHYLLFEKFFYEFKLHEKLTICIAKSEKEIIAGAIFISTPKISTFIFSGNSEIGKKNGAMHALIDYFIKKYLSKGQVLDFEGSVDEGLMQFYMAFGGEMKNYLQIY